MSFLLPVLSSAQITITNADLPSSGDQIQFSQAAVSTPVDLTLTGANYLWDFSQLQHTSQDVDTFLSVLSTPLVYAFVFGFNSNQAMRGVDLSAVPQVPSRMFMDFIIRARAIISKRDTAQVSLELQLQSLLIITILFTSFLWLLEM